MRLRATSPDRTRTWTSGLPPTYVNTVTHWWDLSQVYGSTEERNRALRSGEDGKLGDRRRDAARTRTTRSSTAST